MLGNPLASMHERPCQQLIEIVIWEVNVRAAKWRWWLEFVPALFRGFAAAHPDSDSDSDSDFDSEAAVRRRSAPQDWGGGNVEVPACAHDARKRMGQRVGNYMFQGLYWQIRIGPWPTLKSSSLGRGMMHQEAGARGF